MHVQIVSLGLSGTEEDAADLGAGSQLAPAMAEAPC